MKKVLAVIVIMVLCLPIIGCRKQEKVDLSPIKDVCRLATLASYYHNVADYEDEGKTFIITYGNKKAWIEYSGITKLGIKADEIDIDGPDKSNTITITMPSAEVLSVDLDNESIRVIVCETGLFAKLTAEDQQQAVSQAQKNMEETVKKDVVLRKYAEKRARDMIEQYIKNVGNATGRQFTINWENK